MPTRTVHSRIVVPCLPLTVLVVAACGFGAGPDVRELSMQPQAGLVTGLTGRQAFVLTARGDGGELLDPSGADWFSADARIASVDQAGVVRGVSEGVTEVTARLNGVAVSATVEVYVPPVVTEYRSGVSYFGRNSYVEYVPGTLPLVLSVGHDGTLTPDEIPDRAVGVTAIDRNTLGLTLAVRDAFIDLTGEAPHIVISRLDRRKLDPNRDVPEAAQNDPFAERAWTEYHAFIEQARSLVAARGGGLYIDMHGHGHPTDRLELGYLLGPDLLNRPDANLNGIPVIRMTSIREMGRLSPLPFSQLLRGPTSLGGFLEDQGVPVVPGPSQPSPGTDPYFTGGYSTARHGSLGDTEVVSGIQIEHHYPGIRDTDPNRRAYAARLAIAIRAFALEHFGYFEP